MNKQTILIRSNDNKIFHPTDVAHWSSIISSDGETDLVKWIGANIFVSNTKGYTYKELQYVE